ncbi:hypothetical protein BVRB_1g010490 [Beta vulgaris subsp. vulgaris]|uniref:uncharacterized protein LOC104894581 isoform X7 n=1 Tax=Beta vulgaris subsp. vulgaris TaxID=3555 RepID=UPI00053FAF72|nr:uncharacterized protein LOC104894581 isoform X7 [Beta vulgaris subsp. vulgaris]KMT19662.1 hypothetical protein BVRB_1g010490 [Beta vulgaris subsp. vulgaris]
MRIRVKGGGHTSQIYAIRQSIAKALVAYYQKFVDVVLVLGSRILTVFICNGTVSNGGPGNGWIELVLVEAKDLVGADFRGTSDHMLKSSMEMRRGEQRIIDIYANMSSQTDLRSIF